MFMTSTLRILFAALVAGAGLVLLTPTQAYACSCVGGDAEQFTEWADVVFTGTAVDYAPPPEQPMMSSSDPATYTFDVDTVFKGSAAPTTQVRSAWSGASCGLENIEVGTEYVVFAAPQSSRGRGNGELWANLCGGTARASQNYVADVEAVTGPGEPPEPAVAEPAAAEPAAAEETGRSTATTIAIAGGGLLVLGIIGGFVAYVRRDKRPSLGDGVNFTSH